VKSISKRDINFLELRLPSKLFGERNDSGIGDDGGEISNRD